MPLAAAPSITEYAGCESFCESSRYQTAFTVVPLDSHVAPSDGMPGPDTASVDVGSAAGTPVYSPVSGVMASVTPYIVAGESEGYEVVISPTGTSGVAVVITHLDPPGGADPPSVGSAVTAGSTVLGFQLE